MKIREPIVRLLKYSNEELKQLEANIDLPDRKYIFDYRDDLRQAHWLKEKFYEICQNEKYSEQRKDFWDWIKIAERSGLPAFEKCAITYRNWSKEILNAFKYGYTNGFTEGCNNKIKVLKRISFGVRNFKLFRTRIMLTSM